MLLSHNYTWTLGRAIAAAEGLAYWSSTAWYDEVIKLSIAALEDENRAVADAYAGILGELAASSHSPAAKNAVSLFHDLILPLAGRTMPPKCPIVHGVSHFLVQ